MTTPAPAPAQITYLDRSPPGEPYVNGMQLGSSVDAITGEVLGSAIDPNTFKETSYIPSDAGESFEVKTFEDSRELAQTTTVGASSSVSAPVDGITVGGSRSLDFSDSDTTSDSSMYYVLTWQRVGPIRSIADGFKLSETALKAVGEGKSDAAFRESFGDYYVSQIATGAKFSAVWRCTASDSSSLQAFKTSMTANVEATDAVSGSASLEMAINKSAKSHDVTVNCKYDIVGNAAGIEYDTNSVNTTFQSFLKVVELAPTTIYLKHYNTVDPNIPYTIPMNPDVYTDLIQFYGQARYVLFLSGVAPGSLTSRSTRGDEVRNLFKKIISERQTYMDDPASMEESLRTLKALRTKYENLLDRQDLISQVRSLTFDDLRKLFNVDHQTNDGAWIMSERGRTQYEFGRNSFSDDERKRYAVNVGVQVDHRKFGAKIAHSQASQLTYPGGDSSASGIVVGVIVEDNWGDGTNGRWCLPMNSPLGTSGFQIPIHTRVSRGLHWTLRVSYIANADYDE